jgi:hypothetical protein
MFVVLTIPMATVRTDIKELHRKILRRAIARVYDSEGAACSDMAVRQSHWSEEMAGERPLNLDNKTNLDVRVWSWYALYLAAEFGLPEELETASAIKKRMLRVELRPVADRRRSA